MRKGKVTYIQMHRELQQSPTQAHSQQKRHCDRDPSQWRQAREVTRPTKDKRKEEGQEGGKKGGEERSQKREREEREKEREREREREGERVKEGEGWR